jgi:hypothetical protein
LIRVGIGSATAPYSIGVASSTQTAQKQATDDLNRRLSSEAELVPCPKCLWINDELIRGYRSGRYLIFGKFASAFAIIGACIPLIFALIYYFDPAAAWATLPYLLICGTLFSWLIALGFIGLRNYLRSRILPNQFFPQAPKLPPGIPTAFVVDPSGDELVPATSSLPPVEFTNGWLDFRVGNDHIPMLCCDCLQIAPAGLGYTAHLSDTINLEIPRCADCARLVRRTYWRNWFTTAVSGLLLVGATVPLLGMKPPDLWLVVGSELLILLALASFVASIAIAPVKVSGRDITRGTVKLRFRNPEYASLIAKHLSSL